MFYNIKKIWNCLDFLHVICEFKLHDLKNLIKKKYKMFKYILFAILLASAFAE